MWLVLLPVTTVWPCDGSDSEMRVWRLPGVLLKGGACSSDSFPSLHLGVHQGLELPPPSSAPGAAQVEKGWVEAGCRPWVQQVSPRLPASLRVCTATITFMTQPRLVSGDPPRP